MRSALSQVKVCALEILACRAVTGGAPRARFDVAQHVQRKDL
jgi:hypothetical protein